MKGFKFIIPEDFDFAATSTRLITEQLYGEYKRILWRYKVKLEPCLIEITSSGSNWGSWVASTRTICISQKLINQYAWTTVIEILKHEMAHQYVEEAFPNKDVHGDSFKKACDVLGVASWARTSSGTLPDEIPSWKTAKLSDVTKRHIDKVNKLLSLAASENENEAALAMQRAQEILSKHRLERVREHHATGCDYWFAPFKTQRVDATTKIIFGILRSFYFVRPILTSYFDAKDLQIYKAYDVAGNAEDLQMAEYVYEFLKRTVDGLWLEHKAQTGAPGAAKRSYCMGVLNGFRAKLNEAQAKRAVEPGSQELILLDAKAIEKFLKSRYPNLSTGSAISGARHKASYTAGISDGRKIVLNKPISTSDGNRGRLLG